MADIELVIKIPEDVYTRLFDNGIQDNEIATDDICEMARSLRLGAPLPKGHGRLIDADKLELDDGYSNYDGYYHKYSQSQIYNAPTIIEADKEYEVEVVTRGNCMICGKELTEGLFFCKECEDKVSSRKRGINV